MNAVAKIRDVLGPTDPSKAPPGSIRREFGSTIMVNAAHASDSPENARREMGIVNVGENNFRSDHRRDLREGVKRRESGAGAWERRRSRSWNPVL